MNGVRAEGDLPIVVGRDERAGVVVVRWPVDHEHDARLRLPPSSARLLAAHLVAAADAMEPPPPAASAVIAERVDWAGTEVPDA